MERDLASVTRRLRTIAPSAAGPSCVEVAEFRVCFSRRFPAASVISNSASLRAPSLVRSLNRELAVGYHGAISRISDVRWT